jgi:hypothetical protein
MKTVMALAALVAISAPAAFADKPIPFEVGQVWTLHDAPPEARFTIMQIDPAPNLPGGLIVHGSPTGFPPVEANGKIYAVSGGHMPFSEDAMRSSVDKLEKTGAPVTPAFRAGYREWSAAHGGVFSITVAKAIAYSAEVLRSGARNPR